MTKHKRLSSQLLPLIIILIVGTALRFYHIGGESLWQDEGTSHAFATMPLGDLLGEKGKAETNPPLYYFLLHLWVHIFGDSEAALRTPSALFSVLSLVFTYAAGHWFMNRRAGLFAAAISATMPFHVEYAQEARAYTLMLLGATIAVAGFARLLRNPDSAGTTLRLNRDWRAWSLYILGTSITLYAHNAGVFLPSSLTIAAVIAFCLKPKQFGIGFAANWLAANVIVILIWLPWILVVLNQVNDMSSFWIQLPNPVEILNTPLQIYLPIPNPARLLSKLAVAVAGIAFAAYCFRRKRWDLFAAMALLTGSVFVQVWIASLYQPIFIPRIFVWTLPMFALAMAIGTASISKPSARYLLAGCLIAANLLALPKYYNKPDKEYWRQLAEAYEQVDNKETLTLIYPADIHMPLGYYLGPAHLLEESAMGIVNNGDPIKVYGSHLVDKLVRVNEIRSKVKEHQRLLIVIRETKTTDAAEVYSSLETEFILNTLYQKGHLSITEGITREISATQ
ncbi:glycosyltransferase family 39 protein [Pelagicoccus sp. SDUM812002]|uniref:glycosyltransferase family 39 protein n=1 Tax=Pelagicoccus sp. SDUM812002 TaxID=3041266 RepID=UPI00280F2CED|nr:glycosyltransferase family 39 protein [Pelagicoccus sp. SDUM812002]MDQ8187869.1 glycosyltransferase family 39 protein [Pelagicoccus sp. SDUM812002]